MTNSQRMRESAVMISSTMPSAKYSCSGSPLIFWNGKTAIDGLSGSAGPESLREKVEPATPCSAKYSCCGSPLTFWESKTAADGSSRCKESEVTDITDEVTAMA